MGLLRNHTTGRAVALGARVTVGRSGSSALRLDSRLVSNEHASLWWEAGSWMVRDNGSRNGTWLDGRTLAAGERAAVKSGAVLVFGHPEHTWQLVEAGAPVALARSSSGTVALAAGGILALPDPESPIATVFERADGQWVLEAEDVRVVEDGAALVVAGSAWILHLPVGDASTWSAAEEPRATGAPRMVFRVSRDGEFVEIVLERAGERVAIPTRTHHELLLTLARARVEDAEHPPAEQGWRYADEVQREVGVDSAALNLHIFRARRQLADVGLIGAASVVERRPSTGQLRLGFADVRVEPLV